MVMHVAERNTQLDYRSPLPMVWLIKVQEFSVSINKEFSIMSWLPGNTCTCT